MRFDRDSLMLLLAADCADCSMKPPLQPTMCAIIRTLALRGETSFVVLAEVVPCDEEALRQQVSRLTHAGLVFCRKVYSARRRRQITLCSLTSAGQLLVRQWEHAAAAMLQRLRDSSFFDQEDAR